jgi:pimeloyl-ACP methyl ester carboxylesterase
VSGGRVIVGALLGLVLVTGCTSTPTPVPPTSATTSTAPTPTAPQSTPTLSPTATYGPIAADPRLAPFYSQHLTWSGCGGGFQCATLKVPLDYAQPTGTAIDLAVVRLRSAGGAPRIGSLILNPGGPGGGGGGGGARPPPPATQIVSDAVRAQYDVVGFDPRGVGASDPIRCLTGPETDQLLAVTGNPRTPAEVSQVVAESAVIGKNCHTREPALIDHLGTRNVGQDLDILRAALGDTKLYYLGKSYGTFIGATFAEEFPTHVGRMVLDGAVDPSLSADQMALGQALGFELALSRFVADCEKFTDCPLSGGVVGGLAQIRGFVSGLATNPLPGDGKRQLVQALGVTGIVSALYDPTNGWPALRTALTSAFTGDGSVLLQLVDFYTQRNSNGTFANNGTDALYAVDCLDRPDETGPLQTAALATKWTVLAPTFGAYLAWGNLPCYNWPAAPADGPHTIAAPGSPPILVVGTTHDPATPYPWAKSLASQLSKGVLLTWTGDGHTAYRLGSPCIDSAVDRYLLSGVTPAVGTVCN